MQQCLSMELEWVYFNTMYKTISCHWTLNYLGYISSVSANIISMDTVLSSQGPTGDGQSDLLVRIF